MSNPDLSTPNLARKSVRQRVSNREARLPFKLEHFFSFFFYEKKKENSMLAFRVVCCSHYIDRRIRICILRQSDHCTRVSCTNQIAALGYVLINHITNHMTIRQSFTCANCIPPIKFHFVTLAFAPLRVISLYTTCVSSHILTAMSNPT